MVKIHVIPSSKEKQNSDLYSKVPNYNMQRLNSVTRPSEVDISKYKSEIGLLKPKTEIDLQQSNTKTELVPNIGVQKYNSKNDLFEIKSAVDDISKPEVDVKIKSELLVPEFDNEINSDIVLPESNLINNENILIETPEVSDENNIAEATTDFTEDKTEIIEDKQDILNILFSKFLFLNILFLLLYCRLEKLDFYSADLKLFQNLFFQATKYLLRNFHLVALVV
jgi:hypothetical protein